jgi:hypothetical protein
MIVLGITLGLIGGIFGIFFRNCMKVKHMIFNWWYKILKGWVDRKDESKFREFIAWISYPLGYCIYCSTTWITIFLCMIYLSKLEVLPEWQDLVILLISSMGIQHLVVSIACRFLIDGHPDLNNTV